MPFHDNDHVHVEWVEVKPEYIWGVEVKPEYIGGVKDTYWGNLEGESDWSEATFTPPDKAQLYMQQESYLLDKKKISTAGSNGDFPTDIGEKVPTEEANLISSRISRISAGNYDGDKHGYHRPAIDLDMECELVPSSTPGHYHLYIDKPMTWDQYQYLMYALQKVGIVQEGWVEASMERGQSMVRKPGVKKGVEAPIEERPHWGMQCNCPHCPASHIENDKEPF